jgi:membrane associated rhomboid family serine protease
MAVSALGGAIMEPLAEEVFSSVFSGGRVVTLFLGPWELLPVPLGLASGALYGVFTGAVLGRILERTMAGES